MGAKEKLCVHCLKAAGTTKDHIFPDSWYPDNTPVTVQHWTVPSCLICNRTFGELEEDFLVRLAGSVDPKEPAASGIHERALRSMGIGVTEELPEAERKRRAARRAEIAAEFTAFKESEATISGLGPSDGTATLAVALPMAGFSMLAEKIARGCEFKFYQRLVIPPYDVATMMWSERAIPIDALPLCRELSFGPGLKVTRAAKDGRVHYWMMLWNTLGMRACIATVDDLRQMPTERFQGKELPNDTKAMRVPELSARVSASKGESLSQRTGRLPLSSFWDRTSSVHPRP